MKKYFTKSIVILLVALLTLMFTSVATAGTSVATGGAKKGFDGAWETIDTLDGSYWVMTINSDNSSLMMYDFGATICGSSAEISWSFEATDILAVDDDEWEVTGDGLCVADPTPHYTGVTTFTLRYNKQSDTIVFSQPGYEVTFSRIGKK